MIFCAHIHEWEGLPERHTTLFEDTFASCGHICQVRTRTPGVDTCVRCGHVRQVNTRIPGEDT